MKFTVTVMTTSTGTPLSVVGVYRHWRTASSAASLSIGMPRRIFASRMLPSLAMIASMMTIPEIFAVCASGG